MEGGCREERGQGWKKGEGRGTIDGIDSLVLRGDPTPLTAIHPPRHASMLAIEGINEVTLRAICEKSIQY
jgi:hypothetical protein